MMILLAGTMITWLAVCAFVVALCVVAKQGDAATVGAEVVAEKPLPEAGRSAAATGMARPLHLV
jgi:hypothetical protein